MNSKLALFVSTIASQFFLFFSFVHYESDKTKVKQSKEVNKTAESALEEFKRSHNFGDWVSFSGMLSDEVSVFLIESSALAAGLDRESPQSVRFYRSFEANLKKYSIQEEDIPNIFVDGKEGLGAFSSFDRKKELTAAVVAAYYDAVVSKPEYFVKKGTLSTEKKRAFVDIGIRISPGIMKIADSNFTFGSDKHFRVYMTQTKPNHWVISTPKQWSEATE